MKPETRKRFLDLTLGESFTIPWYEIPSTFGRPKNPATLGLDGRVFTLTPDIDGLIVKRTK